MERTGGKSLRFMKKPSVTIYYNSRGAHQPVRFTGLPGCATGFMKSWHRGCNPPPQEQPDFANARSLLRRAGATGLQRGVVPNRSRAGFKRIRDDGDAGISAP